MAVNNARGDHEELRSQWQDEQRRLASQVDTTDAATPFQLPLENDAFRSVLADIDTNWGAAPSPASSSLPPLHCIAGVDISFVQGTSFAVASLAVFSFPEMKLVATHMLHCEMKVPYICTFLAFREVPALVQLLDEYDALVATGVSRWKPQLLFVDGNGFMHPRGCGVASHLGVIRNIPTIGVAKEFLSVGGLKREEVEAAIATCRKRVMPLLHNQTGAQLGHVALTGNSTKSPIYISPGHQIGFSVAAALSIFVSRFRIPEPIRQADLLSREYIRRSPWLVNGKPDATS